MLARIQNLVAWPAGKGETVAPDPNVRDKFTREVKTARAVARDYFERFPKDLYETAVETWRHLQSDNYEFTMRRLRKPKDKGDEGLSNQPGTSSQRGR
jgi:hypothetical protein